jgi:hypothetical protein
MIEGFIVGFVPVTSEIDLESQQSFSRDYKIKVSMTDTF